MQMGEKGILIFGEIIEQKIDPITPELLGVGRKLADELGEELSAAMIGDGIDELAREIVYFGADRVYSIQNPLLKDYQSDLYVKALEDLCKQIMPKILLIGQTPIGRDLAPRLAFRLNTRLTTDCIDLAIDQETKLLLRTKPVYGGNALAVYAYEERPQLVTVRRKTMVASERDDSRKGEIISIDPIIDESLVRTELVRRVKEEEKGIKLEDAKVIVSGGRGIGGPKGFEQLKELSEFLGGALGASRPPCDSGWVSSTSQVGLTGTIVVPDLYIAIGISGSPQHLAGMSGSKTIVAINKDPDAEIFRVSDYGVVGDYKEILPSFIRKLRGFK